MSGGSYATTYKLSMNRFIFLSLSNYTTGDTTEYEFYPVTEYLNGPIYVMALSTFCDQTFDIKTSSSGKSCIEYDLIPMEIINRDFMRISYKVNLNEPDTLNLVFRLIDLGWAPRFEYKHNGQITTGFMNCCLISTQADFNGLVFVDGLRPTTISANLTSSHSILCGIGNEPIPVIKSILLKDVSGTLSKTRDYYIMNINFNNPDFANLLAFQKELLAKRSTKSYIEFLYRRSSFVNDTTIKMRLDNSLLMSADKTLSIGQFVINGTGTGNFDTFTNEKFLNFSMYFP
jgi:hypothetical protein